MNNFRIITKNKKREEKKNGKIDFQKPNKIK